MPDNGNVISEKNEITNDGGFDDLKDKHSSKIVLVVLVSVVFLMLIVFGGYFYFSRPSKIVVDSINTLYDNFTNLITPENFTNTKEFETMVLDTNFNFNTNIDGLEEINKDKFNFKVGIDYPNKVMSMGAAWNEEEVNILGFLYYFVNNKAYMKFQGDDRLLEIDGEDEDTFNFDDAFTENNKTLNYEDTMYVMDELKDTFVNSLDMGVLKKSREVIKVNGKDEKATKITYPLTGKNVEKIINNFVNKVNSNSKLLDKLSVIYGVDKDTLKENFEAMKNGSYEDAGEINFYANTFSTDLVKLEYYNDGVSVAVIFNDDKDEVIIDNGEYETVMALNVIDNKLVIDFKIADAGISGNASVIGTNKENDNKVIIDFKIKYFGYDFGFTIDSTILTDGEIEKLDVSNAIKMSTIDENYFNDIMEKYMQNIMNSNLYKIFNSINPEMDI